MNGILLANVNTVLNTNSIGATPFLIRMLMFSDSLLLELSSLLDFSSLASFCSRDLRDNLLCLMLLRQINAGVNDS